mmetsp:Transcript_36829/g.89450  ORF Transcript_36829/g.89450 Transcript_36829/m.89450 type:complete len:200 (+) Transcript_36829:882-1481(+)
MLRVRVSFPLTGSSLFEPSRRTLLCLLDLTDPAPMLRLRFNRPRFPSSSSSTGSSCHQPSGFSLGLMSVLDDFLLDLLDFRDSSSSRLLRRKSSFAVLRSGFLDPSCIRLRCRVSSLLDLLDLTESPEFLFSRRDALLDLLDLTDPILLLRFGALRSGFFEPAGCKLRCRESLFFDLDDFAESSGLGLILRDLLDFADF